MSKSDEETFNNKAVTSTTLKIKEKTKSDINVNTNLPHHPPPPPPSSMAAAEEFSTLSPEASCSVNQTTPLQQQLTPKSHKSKRSSSNKSKKANNKNITKETFFDASSLNSTSSNDENSIYSLANNMAPPNLIVPNTITTTANVMAAVNNFNSNTYVDNVITKDPIVIRGSGNITIFGVCNKFNEQFPTQLNAKLAPEEFRDTIKQINSILNKELENSFKWLVFGSIFCCCTLGCSLLPVIYMNKKAKLCISKLLEMENQRLYLKLGLKWRLAKLKCNSNSLLEYVLLIEFLPTLLLYQPD
jgi:hypothetical protein